MQALVSVRVPLIVLLAAIAGVLPRWWHGAAAAQVLPLDFPEPVTPPNSLCDSRCFTRSTAPIGGRVPSNFRILIDGNRYDVSKLSVIHRVDELQSAVVARAIENNETAETGVWEVAIDDPAHPMSVGRYVVVAPVRETGRGVAASFTFPGEVDTTPPIAEGLRLDMDEIFSNDCGAKAILIRANLAFDPMAQGPGAKALLVKLESATATHLLWSSITRAGAGFRNGWLHDGPYFQDCIGPTGIETLELCGEVRVTFTLFDHAGNAAEPITQVVQWPAELGPQDAACPEVPSGGCAVVRPGSDADAAVLLGLVLLALFGSRRVYQAPR